jgi:hypothetical protein
VGTGVHPSAKQFAPYVKALGNGGMSDDECLLYNGCPIYCSMDPVWRSAEVRKMLHALDFCNLDTHFDIKGSVLSGQFPRARIRGKIDTEATPVTGLPENFYNSQWLEKQDEIMRMKLDIRPARDISLPDDLLR